MYVEISFGVKDRGNVYDIAQIPIMIRKAQDMNSELFSSYYLYDISILEYLKKHKTVRNFDGIIYPPKLLKVDIDKGSDTAEFTLTRAHEFYKRLLEDFHLALENIGVFFSGSGYHFYFPNIFKFEPKENLHIEVKETMQHYFPEADNIYDKTRIFRVVNTINKKTGLYKIQLDTDTFLQTTVTDVLSYAAKPRPVFQISTEDFPTFSVHKVDTTIHTLPKTTSIVTCMQHLYNRGPIKGRRHTDLLRLASAWRRQGLSIESSKDLARVWVSSLIDSEIQNIIDSVYEKGYTYSCNDAVMQEFCDPKCIFYTHKNYTVDVLTPNDLEESLMHFLNSDVEPLDLADIYHMSSSYKMYPEEVVIITADTGLGKSAWVQSLVHAWKVPTLYLSLEMHAALTYRRFLQIAYNMSREEIEEHYKNGRGSLAGALNYLKVVTQYPTIENLEKLIRTTLPQLVVIDVIDGIVVKNMQDESKMGIVIQQLKSLAEKYKIIILGIHHISKAAAYEGKLNVHSLKGASAIEQKADKVIGMEGNRDTFYRKIFSLKARDEDEFNITLFFDKKKSMRFYELKE